MKAKKQVNPLVGMMGSLEMMKEAALGNRNWRKDALTTELPSHSVDTCAPLDTGTWETGVKPKDQPWVIVEQYEDAAAAQKGHIRWVQQLTSNPDTELHDIHVWGVV